MRSTHWLCVNLEEGTSDNGSLYWVDVDKLDEDEACFLDAADFFGHYGEEARAIVRRVGVPISVLVECWELVNELEMTHLLISLGGGGDSETFCFRVDGDGEELEGIITARFNVGDTVVIDGVTVLVGAGDLPAVLVDCGENGSWLAPLAWAVGR